MTAPLAAVFDDYGCTPDAQFAAEQRERWYEAGRRAARDGVLHTETWWPQARKDAYAAGWLRCTGQQVSS